MSNYGPLLSKADFENEYISDVCFTLVIKIPVFFDPVIIS
jgi:hypothetical protein